MLLIETIRRVRFSSVCHKTNFELSSLSLLPQVSGILVSEEFAAIHHHLRRGFSSWN